MDERVEQEVKRAEARKRRKRFGWRLRAIRDFRRDVKAYMRANPDATEGEAAAVLGARYSAEYGNRPEFLEFLLRLLKILLPLLLL